MNAATSPPTPTSTPAIVPIRAPLLRVFDPLLVLEGDSSELELADVDVEFKHVVFEPPVTKKGEETADSERFRAVSNAMA